MEYKTNKKNYIVTKTIIEKTKRIAKTEILAENDEEAKKKISEAFNASGGLGVTGYVNDYNRILLELEETINIEEAK